jgi:hypothetical protein
VNTVRVIVIRGQKRAIKPAVIEEISGNGQANVAF